MEQRTAVAEDTIIMRDGENYRGNRQRPLDQKKMPEYEAFVDEYLPGCG
jgi:hypothetical protein